MDWKNLYLSANGRSGQKEFWIGWLVLFVASFVLSMIPVLNLLSIVLLYPFVCLYSKRLHDAGRSGWLAAIPIAVNIIGMVLMGVLGGAAMMAGMAGGSEAAMASGAMASMGLLALVGLAMLVIQIGFLLWVGLAKGDPNTNQYGPPPGETATAQAY